MRKGGTLANHAAVTVTTAATQILAPNTARKGYWIYNASGVNVGIGFDTSITMTNTPLLGTTKSATDSGAFDVWRGSIYGIVTSSTGDIYVQEW